MAELGRTAGAAHRKELLAYGDPEFRGTGAASPAQTRAGELVRAAYEKQGLRFAPLPNTRGEVQEIGTLIPRTLATIYVGREATKESVQRSDLLPLQANPFRHARFCRRAPAIAKRARAYAAGGRLRRRDSADE
jgi:hypothetical protein